MSFSKEAKWIWLSEEAKKDEYAAFKTCFIANGEKTLLRLVAETKYIAYVNGSRVGFGPCAGYPDEKYYDELDITEYVRGGSNELKIVVWYEGFNSATHIDDGAGLIFSVISGDKEVAYSSFETLGGKELSYLHGREKPITVQLGYTSAMVAGKEVEYGACREIEKNCVLKKRPVKNMVERPFEEARLASSGVYDLGREVCGYLRLSVACKNACTVKVSYGEHLVNGRVPRLMPGGYKNVGRDFSLDFICKEGTNEFEQFFVRIAGRYLSVESDGEIQVQTIGILPYEYPLTEKEIDLEGLDEKIYEISVRTLRLCMHEHYEDCPWREQALYVMDSRNQMLCGYYAFEGREFQRANLALIAKGRRADGLLELTYPAVETPAIPFFSLMYPVAVWEYIEHTKDLSVLDETWDTLCGVMKAFENRIDETGLVRNFEEPFWNFYEWSEGSDNEQELDEGVERKEKHDLILNCAYVYALERYQKIRALRGERTEESSEKLREKIKGAFYDEEKGLYFLSDEGERKYSQLGNAFACLIGLGDKRIERALREDATLIKATLSMQAFVYDALLNADRRNASYVLEDIRKNYSYMLEKGATSFWETLSGVTEKEDACSLCHGWSAIPIYYYNILK